MPPILLIMTRMLPKLIFMSAMPPRIIYITLDSYINHNNVTAIILFFINYLPITCSLSTVIFGYRQTYTMFYIMSYLSTVSISNNVCLRQ